MLMKEKEAAAFLGMSPRSLRSLRAEGTGPQHVRLGRAMIRYTKSDLEAYIEQNRVKGRVEEAA